MASICMAFILDSTNILLMPATPARTLPTGVAAAASPLRHSQERPTTRRQTMPRFRLHATFVALLCAATAAWGQQPLAEEPGWAKGRPKTEAAQRMAPVPAFPIPTAPD